MNFLRPLAGTPLKVSALGLGTVKFGRNQGVKYPTGFDLPDNQTIIRLLARARELGINLLDTAPAYGSSEQRLGELLEHRHDWVIVTKVGEEFADGQSSFDFTAAHTRLSVERSLQRLRTDYLDLVLIHSDGNDLDIINHSDCIETLRQCQQAGLVRHIGMSIKTDAGGVLAAQLLDVLMLTWNLQQQDRATLAEATALNKGVLVKKGLMSGHLQSRGRDLVLESMQLNFSQPHIHSMIVGTLNTDHLEFNVKTANAVIARQS